MERFMMVLLPDSKGWRRLDFPNSSTTSGDEASESKFSTAELQKAIGGSFEWLNVTLGAQQRRDVAPFHFLMDERGKLRNLKPTVAISVAGPKQFNLIVGPLIAVRDITDAEGDQYFASLIPGDEQRIRDIALFRTIPLEGEFTGKVELWDIFPLMPRAASPTSYGVAKFRHDINFSPIISDQGSLDAVVTILRKFGRRVRAFYLGNMGGGAHQLHLVFDRSIVGEVSYLYHEQP